MTTITAPAAPAARPTTPPSRSTTTAAAMSNNTPTRSGFAASPGRVRTRGFFDEGVWKCNCQPRRPAVHFETRNGGKNHGRWFYTCQESPPRRCDFFLWDDEAKLREKKAVLNNTRTEPGSSQAQQPQPQASQRPQYQQTRLPQLQQTQLQLQDNQLLQQTQQSRRRRKGTSSPRQHQAQQGTHNDIKVESESDMPQQSAATLNDGRQTPPSQFYSWPPSDIDDTQDLDELVNTSFDSEIGSTNRHQGRQPQPTTPRKRQRGDLDNKDDDGYSYRPVPSDPLSGQPQTRERLDRAASPTLQGNRHDARPAAVKSEHDENQAQVSNLSGAPKPGSYHSTGTLIPPNTGIATPEVTPANPSRTYDPLGRQGLQNQSYLAGPSSTPAISAANLRAQNQQPLSQQQQQLSTPKTPQGSSICTNLTSDVFGLLHTSGITLPQDTSEALQELCNRYVLVAYGIERGRESVRAAVRDRDATIAELTEKNAALEEEIKSLKRMRKSEAAGVATGASAEFNAGSLASTSYNPSRMHTAAEAQRQTQRQQQQNERGRPAMRSSMTSSGRLQAGMFSNIPLEAGNGGSAGRDSSTSLTESESE